MKTLLSGVKPTGRPHIGNYFGALQQFVSLQHEYACLFMIADYHALNTTQDKETMRDNILGVALDYLAIGLNPAKSIIFKQSDVQEHTELAWIFDTLTTMPYLMRAHAFKDAEAKNKEINVGTFNYPMLMAADILLYDAAVVPVGQDQKQHIEIARDTAQKFNNTYGETFHAPQPLIIESVATVPGIDGQKMSKSYNNTIPLFSSRAEIQDAVMRIVTDSGTGIPKNVYALHALFRTESELAALYEEHAGKYKILKEALIEDIDAFIQPLREKREALVHDIEYVYTVLREGGKRASEKASNKMKVVRENIGVSL